MPNERSHTVHINGFDLHYEERGEGEPLVLLHGFMGSSDNWRHAFDLDELSREYRLIMPDARGHGRSTNPTGTFSFRQCAIDAFALLEYLEIDRFRAIGFSLGGNSLLHMAT